MPGGDARETAKTVIGSFEDFPYLAELPARGPGSDMIGRTIGLLVEMYAHLEPSGWRVSDRPGHDTRRARSWLGEDLDALEEFTQGYEGPLKVQAVGPWTLAAGLELRGGEAVLGDPGACRDLTASLAEGCAGTSPRCAAGCRALSWCSSSTSRRSSPYCAGRSGRPAVTGPTGPWTGSSSRARCAT